MTLSVQPRILTSFLEKSLNNGQYKLTYEQIAYGLWKLKTPTKQHVDAIRHAWPQSEKQLRRLGTCAILVTQLYFDSFPRREPKNPEAISLCIAYHWRKSVGIRLLTAKGIRNDPMALMYFYLRTRNSQGTMSALEDRAVVEWKKGKLSKRTARRIVDRVTQLTLPQHQLEFSQLMDQQ
jgi:hypothetical protein